MKRCLAALLILAGAAWLGFLPATTFAQTNAPDEVPKLAAQEKEACTRNLKLIYDAIQAYQLDHKDLPNWLSDLVPQYISDANVLICPVCKRTGEIESSELADPKLPCSYLYQFCPIPLGKKESPNDPTKTRREWKRRQMGLIGSIVPLVRCHHHAAFLNLAFDGRVYDSPPQWENAFSNQVDVADLMPSRIFPGGAEVKTDAARIAYPPRDPQAGANLINLSDYYNALLTESWHGATNNDLASLPSGVQTFAGVQYDVRGVIQLSGKLPSLKTFPFRVNSIKIHQKCERLHFLQAATFGSPKYEGEQIGAYVLHFAANQMHLEIPIVYGRDVRDWYASSTEKPGSKELTVAWAGVNEAATAIHHSIRLFTSTWTNVAPGVEIESLDFVSATNKAAPFVIAITAD